MPMKKKAIWAGVVSGQIRFFGQDPEGNVNGLQGYRKFNVTDQLGLVDDHGTNILDNTALGQGATDDSQSGAIAAQSQQLQSQGGQETA